MILLKLINHKRLYYLESMCILFFPGIKIKTADNLRGDRHNIKVSSRLIFFGNGVRGVTEISADGKKARSVCSEKGGSDKNIQSVLKKSFYNAALRITEINVPWGVLTGIRPSKIAIKLMNKGYDEKNIIKVFEEEYYTDKNKALLCIETAKHGRKAASFSQINSASLYIAIPFCPSRCAYCSFVSHSVEQAAKLIPVYVDRLCEEIKAVGKVIKNCKLKLESIYIGGGTPSVLTAEQIKRLLNAIKEHIDINSIREFTFEAGRPDTITDEKLAVLRQFQKMRLSINPQTLSDDILVNIGREHTVKQFFDAFGKARDAGFDFINADLIAGLPEDSFDSFKRSLDGILALSPENITVHTLCVKRAAHLTMEGKADYSADSTVVSDMLDYAVKNLSKNGYHPYYMYRQKNTVGNLENIGFAKEGFDCLYNIFMMDEVHTVLGAGAGAVTKLVNPYDKSISRVYNYKYPYEYIERFDDILKDKDKVELFYERLEN